MPVKMEEIRMKKGIYLCLCIALLFTAVSISADDVDFSNCSLEELTRDLLLYNRTRLRELEMAKEKKQGGRRRRQVIILNSFRIICIIWIRLIIILSD